MVGGGGRVARRPLAEPSPWAPCQGGRALSDAGAGGGEGGKSWSCGARFRRLYCWGLAVRATRPAGLGLVAGTRRPCSWIHHIWWWRCSGWPGDAARGRRSGGTGRGQSGPGVCGGVWGAATGKGVGSWPAFC